MTFASVEVTPLSDLRLHGDVEGREREIMLALAALRLPAGGRVQEDGTVSPVVDPDKDDREVLETELVPLVAARLQLAQATRKMLADAGVAVGGDLGALGCTGLHAAGCAVDTIRMIRGGLAGSGLGLPCYVGPDRYCLAHEAIGGLQDGQSAKHAGSVSAISRDLLPKEQAHMELVSAARHTKGAARGLEALEQLMGRKAPEGMEFVEDDAAVVNPHPDLGDYLADVEPVSTRSVPVTISAASLAAHSPVVDVLKVLGYALMHGMKPEHLQALFQALCADYKIDARSKAVIEMLLDLGEAAPQWECDEHAEPNWACRFCLAQAVAKGPLDPQVLLFPSDDGARVILDNAVLSEGHDSVLAKVQQLDEMGADAAAVFVKAVVWRRRFARD